MPVNERLLQILACPLCKVKLEYRKQDDKLACNKCSRIYDVRDDIPVMLVDEAGIDLSVLQATHPEVPQQPRSNPLMQITEGLFTATYFPWSIVLNEETLKRSLLYFDKIYLLAPGGQTLDDLLTEFAKPDPREELRSPLFTTSTRERILSFYNKIKPLRDEGIIVTIDSNSLLSQSIYTEELENISFGDAINYDMANIDTDLSFLVKALDKGTLMAREIDPSGDVAFHYWDTTLAKSIYPNLKKRVEEYIEGLPKQAQVFLRHSIKMPDAVIRALILNVSLFCIQECRSVPLTDNPDYLRIMLSKYRRIFDSETNEKAKLNRNAMYRFVAKSNTKSGMLGNFVLELLLPNIDYKNLEDILELRERFKDHLQLFRLKMTALSTEIQGTIADAEFYEHCRKIILKDIVPPLLDLQKKISLSNLKILKDFMKNMLSLKPTVPFIVSAFTPLPVYAAALVAAGIISLETALESYIERRNLLYDNALAYLLDVNKNGIALDESFWNRSGALASAYGI